MFYGVYQTQLLKSIQYALARVDCANYVTKNQTADFPLSSLRNGMQKNSGDFDPLSSSGFIDDCRRVVPRRDVILEMRRKRVIMKSEVEFRGFQ